VPFLKLFDKGKGRFSFLPLAGGWTKYRDLPAPESRTFMQQLRDREVEMRQAA
jgi:L-lactate dehydrogenase complex protein LldF